MESEFTEQSSINNTSHNSSPSNVVSAVLTPSTAPLIFDQLLNSLADPALPWEPFREGIEAARIYSAGPGGPSAAFLRYQPGASLGRHRHQGYEHILILSGSQIDDNGEHLAGTLIVHPPGSSHGITSVIGCVVLAIWEKPVIFEME